MELIRPHLANNSSNACDADEKALADAVVQMHIMPTTKYRRILNLRKTKKRCSIKLTAKHHGIRLLGIVVGLVRVARQLE